MSTAQIHVPDDERVQVPVTWGAYKRLLRARGDGSRPKHTFLAGRMTIVSAGHSHEEHKKRLGGMIEDILTGLMIDFNASGEVTLFTSLRPRAGTEADETCYLTNIARVRGKKQLLMGVDPPPDLVLEVVFGARRATPLRLMLVSVSARCGSARRPSSHFLRSALTVPTLRRP
jgi:Uma2 family endonuclease